MAHGKMAVGTTCDGWLYYPLQGVFFLMYFLGRLIEQDVSSKRVLKLKDVYIVYIRLLGLS